MGSARGGSASAALVVLVTCPKKSLASRIAIALITRHLAACVNILPSISSVFWWEGRVDRCHETLLIIKTTASRFSLLKRAILELHPYTVPEVIALPIAAGHPPYLKWVRQHSTS